MLSFEPIWFDSMGAKSSCTLVKTPDVSIVIDPGIAAMQPSFPASKTKKLYWKKVAKRKIIKACRKADVIIISHYHHDHYIYDDFSIYENKLLLIKNPNEYINDTQRRRAEEFYEKLFTKYGKRGMELKKNRKGKNKASYPNPLDELQIAVSKNFGSYEKRREELLKKGMKWFYSKVRKWREYEKIPDGKLDGIEIKYAEGKVINFGKTKIRFTKPLFHGIEFSKVGWVFSTIIEYESQKIIHTSDLNGPIIEDYADWIIKENPDILILDGPPTYMLGYMLNKINLERAIKNVIKIMEEIDGMTIYDHHLPREKKFREHTKEVWEYASKKGKRLLTAADYMGKKPIVETL